MMSVLFLVASRREEVSVISDLLDISKSPCKPQYHLADPEPLVLYDCVFNPGKPADSQTARYYELIRSHPLYAPILESSTNKYNQASCSFDDSLSDSALADLRRACEAKVYQTFVPGACALQLLNGIEKEYSARVSAGSELEGDFQEVAARKYTPLSRRSKARRVWGKGVRSSVV